MEKIHDLRIYISCTLNVVIIAYISPTEPEYQKVYKSFGSCLKKIEKRGFFLPLSIPLSEVFALPNTVGTDSMQKAHAYV